MFGLSWVKLAIYAAIVAAIFGSGVVSGRKWGYGSGYDDGAKAKTIEYQAKIDQQKTDAKFLYDQALKRNSDLETAYKQLQTKWSDEHGANQKVIEELSGRVSALGQLRDPGVKGLGRGGCGGSSPGAGKTGASGGAGLQAQASGVLSEELTGFLRSKFKEADGDAEVARLCHDAVVN